MRYTRMLFGLPLACCLAVMAMTFAAPAAPSYEIATAYQSMHPPFDGVFIVAEAAPLALADVEALTRSHADAHAVDYTIANQPGSAWRFAADAYVRIEPHRSTA
ncbi:hypothetical protein JYU29_05690 [Tianweitania sp. BSSL-BM11]|uniref:Uncharacterized protein n=1 Tax=Tianweitania aestuarii TaxID=2814886 RepID=A0ABS5RSZ0_9HYPH|nr:hypothetical protein [Tianweitania aestuarii]MBS9720178.1 hypothetical protein [Tianweitania aestuarii]